MFGLMMVSFFGCAAENTEKDSGLESVEPSVEIFDLEAGFYKVLSAETLPNECDADWSYMDGRDLALQVGESTVIIEGVLMERTDNSLEGIDSEERDWSGIGANCITRIDSVFGGEITSSANLNWTWQQNWSHLGGDGCYEALGHDLPCSYTGVFQLEKVPD